MNILYVTGEAAPFIKTGGLADVAGSLPKAIRKNGHDIRVVLPLYSQIDEKYRKYFNYIGYFYVDIAWMHRYCGVFSFDYEGVTYYFLDNEMYFDRTNIYGEFDDAERFIFFSKAVVVLAKYLNFKADVIHSNDWHSALVSVYLNDFRSGDNFYKDTRSLFTIHNIKYQGIFSPDVFHMTGLDAKYMTYEDFEFNGAINFMKAAIVHSTKFNTVSDSYAEEIKEAFFGHGLESVVKHYSCKLYGIVNGIDYDSWNPNKDRNIAVNYSLSKFKLKKENKAYLQKVYGLPIREDVCMIGMVTRLNSMKGLDLLRHILEELLQEDIQFVVLGTGDYEYEEMFKYFEYKYPEKMASRMYFSTEEANQIYASSDLYMMPSISEPCGISQLIAMKYGSVPIVRETGGLKDTVQAYNIYDKKGTGFSFANINAHELLFKTKEAINMYYSEKTNFTNLAKEAMRAKFDWEKSSEKYIDLYRSL